MKFSLVVPVYNVADYLENCVNSILANDCTDCEILLIDDGSTDGKSGVLCDELAARSPSLVRVIHQENRGLGGARNTGIEAARGEYLFFIDSDDSIAPDSLSVLRRAIKAQPADIYSFQAAVDDGEGKLQPFQTSKVYEGAFVLREHPEFLFALPAAWARIWKRSLFLKTDIRYPCRVWYEDIRTSAKLFAAADSIVTLPDTLYRYLVRQGSITRNANVLRNREILDAFEDILSWFEAQKLTQCYQKELEKLAIDHILLAGSVRVARIDPKSGLLTEFADTMEQKFPNYRENPYLSTLSIGKKLAYRLILGKHYRLLRLLFALRK